MRRHRRISRPLGLRRADEAVPVTFTAREARSMARGIDLVLNELRPGLFANRLPDGEPPPMVTAQEVLIAACERAGVDVGLMRASR